MNRKLGLLDKYKHVVLTGESFVGEFAIREENIRTTWLRIQASKFGDGVAIAASNITPRKEQEDALRRSESLLNRTERLTETGGWEIYLETEEIFWSHEVHRIHGLPASYRPTLTEGIDFYLPEDRVRVSAAIASAIANGDVFDMECTIVRPDGVHVPVRVVGQAAYEDGNPG